MIRDLIRKILKEEFLEQELEIFDLTEIIDINQFLLLNEGKAEVRVPRGVESELQNYVSELNDGNKGFVGYAVDPKTNESRKKAFKLKLTYHYLQRLYRTEESEYRPDGGKYYNVKIVNPGRYEGINLIYNNRDKIAQLHFSNIPDSHLIDKKILFRTMTTQGPFSVLASFEKSSEFKNGYEIILLTQLKGVEFAYSSLGGKSVKINKRVTI